MEKRKKKFENSTESRRTVRIHNQRESEDYIDKMISNAIIIKMSQL